LLEVAMTDRSSPRLVSLSFKDIYYAVKQKETKTILHGLSGSVESGEMLAVMGPSGGGKTSLIHIISRKIVSGTLHHVDGAVLCNGQTLNSTQFRRISGLVTQEDVFNASLSVLETLNFAARLKLPSELQKSRVAEVISRLQLEKCSQTYIGDDSNAYSKGISGGEKRRLAIALEILNPHISILVLDEPTSGLDAAAALNIVNLLQSLSNSGLTVLTTLHQPRSSIMSQFSKLMILAAGRRIFYGHLKEYIPYLQQDLQCQVPMHENPFDLLLDVLNPAISSEHAQMGAVPPGTEKIADLLAELFAKSDLRERMDVEGLATPQGLSNDWRARVSWCRKFICILHRTFIIKMRDPMVLLTQLTSGIMMGLIFGMLYFQSYDKEEQFAILDVQMAVTMSVIMSIWLPFDVTLTFPKERQIFLRERAAGLYSTSVFFLARILADMPMHITAATIMASIIYPLVDLQMGVHLFIVLNVIGILVGASLMQCIGAVSKSFEEANILTMLVMMMSMMTSTGFVRVVPSWLKWMRDTSFMGLIGDICMYLEFKDIDPKYGTPEQVYKDYGVQIESEDDIMLAVSILLATFVIARLLTYLAVKFLHTGRSFKENLAD
jgi:ABC-type multidrug transport system ATPase subunit